MTWFVIVNPSAGRRGEAARRARAALEDRGIDHVLKVSTSADDVSRLVAEGRSRGISRFVSVGGDGTSYLVLNGLMSDPWDQPPTARGPSSRLGVRFHRNLCVAETPRGRRRSSPDR